MRHGKDRQDVTLIDILVDGFEKNEVLDGFHWRDLPMPDEASARRKFDLLVAEATRWKGLPTLEERGAGRMALWDDLRIGQAGSGIHVRARSPRFSKWWHEKTTWVDDPMGAVYDLFEKS